MTAQKMSAQEIIAFIGNAEKKTNVKVTFEGELATAVPASVTKLGNVLFGDWKDIEPLLANLTENKDYVVEQDGRNSAVPLLDKRHLNARIEPGAIIRDQVTIEDNAVVMMGAVINIGAEIGAGTMIDMGAILGGRATVGKNSHIGAGAVLAGVIEPASADPVRIGDNVLVGANAVVIEGVQVGNGSVVAAGAIVTQDVPENFTFDGKIMAIPETNIDDGPNLLWLRRDWMDKLGLESPKTIEDAETIVQAFIEKDPGENGEGKTVGFVCDPELSGECGYSSEYLMDIVFAANGAYPKQWIEDENGEVSYGSVLPQAKDALAKLKSMYERNILDQNFLLRTSVNNIELITKGLCGSFFGPWWAANNPLMEAIAANPDAVWEPFLIQTDDDGSTSYYSQNPTYKYVVVRKGYEHPEIACKIINGLFDYVRYDGTYNSDFEEYYQNNVDPTARPLAINVDYSYALTKCYHELTDVLSGKKEPEDLDLLEYSYYRSCKAYLDNTDSATPEEWAAYTSRITACSLLADAKTNKVESLYFDETETMGTQWWKLRKMEKEYYLQIVTGERDIDAFDEFVTKWYENGGETITQEVREAVH